MTPANDHTIIVIASFSATLRPKISEKMNGAALRRKILSRGLPSGPKNEYAEANDSVAWSGWHEKTADIVSAHDVVQDIKSGMDDEALMIKYRLSFRQLQRLFRKIIIGGFIGPMELAQRLCVTKSQVAEAFVELKKAAKGLD